MANTVDPGLGLHCFSDLCVPVLRILMVCLAELNCENVTSKLYKTFSKIFTGNCRSFTVHGPYIVHMCKSSKALARLLGCTCTSCFKPG